MSTRADRVIVIVKDIILFVGGLSGIAYQQVTNNVNPLLLLIFATMTGIPGVMSIVSLWKSGGVPTGSQQLPSPPSQPPPDLPPYSADRGSP